MRAKDIQTSTMEKQDILQFEIHLAAATNKVCMYVYLMKICLFYDTKWKNNRTASCMKSGEKNPIRFVKEIVVFSDGFCTRNKMFGLVPGIRQNMRFKAS